MGSSGLILKLKDAVLTCVKSPSYQYADYPDTAEFYQKFLLFCKKPLIYYRRLIIDD